jgi:hypothetical protein
MIDDTIKCFYTVKPDDLDYIQHLSDKNPYENINKTLRIADNFEERNLLVLDTIWKSEDTKVVTKMKFVCDTTVRNGFILSRSAKLVLSSMDRIKKDPELDTLFVKVKEKRFKVEMSDSQFTNVLGTDVMVFLGYLTLDQGRNEVF